MTAEHTVDVYCREPSHGERRWDVMRYKRIGPGVWQSSNLRFKSQQRQRLGEVNTQAWLPDEKRYRRLGEALPDETGPAHDRPDLACELCGLRYVRTNTATLHAALDALAAAGESEISLQALIRFA